jgi:hypothetical protein
VLIVGLTTRDRSWALDEALTAIPLLRKLADRPRWG